VSFGSQHLAQHPLPAGIVGALDLGGYQLLGEVAGVGAGRLGAQAFLLVAPDADPGVPDAGTQLALHQPRLRGESEASAYVALAAQLGYMRLSGFRLALERCGLRSKVHMVDPGTGAVLATVPDRAPGRLFGGGAGASRMLAALAALPAAGPAAAGDDRQPELLRQALLALALRDERVGGAEAAELVERALALAGQRRDLDPPALLEAARGTAELPPSSG
jgi:hypothetical protein